MNFLPAFCALLIICTGCTCHRQVRTAQDITPGNCTKAKLDWRYGANDIQIQTQKITFELMNRWYAKTGWNKQCGKPRLIVTQVDNRTDQYISSDLIRDIIEEVAVNDGRFSILVGDFQDELELDSLMAKIKCHPKYSKERQTMSSGALVPQFLSKIRITKAVNSDHFYDYENYRMTITLYDIETQEVIDSAQDVLIKKVKAHR
ncbi:hypothetical protein PHSC3_000265 [Chlamydiales bacterium STE3]|nr:hypothetical protein PHSC3_000265 [Chlamydiales bacterium STE3]